MIENNIIENYIRLDSFLEEYIKKEYLYKTYKKYILIEILNFSYLYPRLIPNKLYIKNKYIVTTQIEFKCLKFYKGQILNNIELVLENKFEDLILLKLEEHNLDKSIVITAIDLNIDNLEKYEKKNNLVKIMDIKMINNNINLIVEHIDKNNYLPKTQYYQYINFNEEDFSQFLKINNKFNIIFNKKKEMLNIKEILNLLKKLNKKEEYSITFNEKSIEINHSKDDEIITIPNTDIFLVNLLIELNNYILL